MAAIVEKPPGSLDPFENLARNDRDAGDLRMGMLLRCASVGARFLKTITCRTRGSAENAWKR